MKTLFCSILLLATTTLLATGNPADAVVGVWKNGSGKGHIQIYKQAGKYYGKIIWLRDGKDEQGHPKLDRRNSDVAKRNQPIVGLVMMKDFVYADGEWNGGKIYNPSDGKEYKAYMRLKDPNTLSVRGYMGFSWIGKTDTWTRVN